MSGWLTDQDSQFKDNFYAPLLPDFKAKRKAVVVVTHDDWYFHLGDRVLKIDESQMVGSQRLEKDVKENELSAKEDQVWRLEIARNE
jgi:putative ATP-binding cassette transporter